jgi:cellulose synthase/poly-beta-1,6-N-acetylglucosamine synthase-like glycosyltransferase
MTDLLWSVAAFFNYLVLAYFLALNAVYLATTVLAFVTLRRLSITLKALDTMEIIGATWAPPITLVAPAYNEEATCVESVRSLLTLEYPDVEVIVVNDGSKDATIERLAEAFNLYPTQRVPTGDIDTSEVRAIYRSRRQPNLWLIDKENGGKADALNVGINYTQTPLFCAMDADSLIEPDALSRITRPFLVDKSTVAVGGVLRIVNGCVVEDGRVTDVRLPRSFLARLQVIEYLRAFLSSRMGWGALNATLVISGAFGIFRREAVVSAGGYATDTVGEDMELIVRLHRHMREKRLPYRIAFIPDPVAWTECPESLAVLGRQRDRWQRGLIQSLMRHRVMLFNPTFGRAGMLAFPYFFFLEMLGPIIELAGYVSFGATVAAGRASPQFTIAFLSVAIVLGGVLSLAAVAMEELTFRRYPRRSDLFRLFFLALVENFGYRQLNAWWRLRGTLSAIRGDEGWGKMTRKGFGDGDVSASGGTA